MNFFILFIEEEEDDGLPIEEAFCSTSYGDVHLLICGAKKSPVYLVMHGDGATSSNEHWRAVLKPLASFGLRVIAISMPGYGKVNTLLAYHFLS